MSRRLIPWFAAALLLCGACLAQAPPPVQMRLQRPDTMPPELSGLRAVIPPADLAAGLAGSMVERFDLETLQRTVEGLRVQRVTPHGPPPLPFPEPGLFLFRNDGTLIQPPPLELLPRYRHRQMPLLPDLRLQ